MWNLGNRGVLVLISALSGCAFLYNIWGPILFLATSLLLVLYVCYSLVVNDSPLSPHAIILLVYIREALLEVHSTVQSSLQRISHYGRNLWQIVNERCRSQLAAIMNRPRRSHYQLSTDSYSLTKNSPTFSSIARLSPIPRNTCKTETHDTGTENKICNDSISTTYRRSGFSKHTSTPMLPREKHTSANGDCEFFSSSHISPKKLQSPHYSLSQTPTSNECGIRLSSDTSPWGTNASPKMRPKASGMKTVQTVAGPLLASTRYNIDPKVYNDVTSPGLTTRLTKYATEANNKLTHQSQYSTGQFPRVNLHASPVPIISPRTAKIRSPVTVRIAPPDATRYSPPGRQNALSHLCQPENKAPPSVVQVLREISLKRHASKEDVTSELPKKQRTDNIICEGYEPIDESKQKRSRDESSKSEEEISPQNKTVRPAKRTKTPSCYDILNSLSSSIHVASGVKRKAMDYSRSGTPQFEKHFKSLESSPNAQIVPQPQSSGSKSSASVVKTAQNSYILSPSGKSPEHRSLKGILKPSTQSPVNTEKQNVKMSQPLKKTSSTVVAGSNTVTQSVNLTDKLFMRAEPERNERLKMLAEEQQSMKPKFTSDDAEEIKKEDIVNMRKTSMKARLQSMFDAISGKVPSKINPDVVIEAEEISVSKPAPCPVTCVTLNSSTTTTNVNTTPISTSAVAPIASTGGDKMTSPNRVMFNVPKTSSTSLISSSVTPTTDTKSVESVPAKTIAAGTIPPSVSSAASTISTGVTNSATTTSGFTFGGQASSITSMPSGDSSHSSTTTSNKVLSPVIPAPIATTTSSMTSNTIFGAKSTSLPSSITSSQTMGKSNTNMTSASSIVQSPATSQVAPTFAFGDKTTSTTLAQSTKSITSTSTVAPASLFSSIPNLSASTSTAITSTVTPASTSASLFTFGHKAGNVETPKSQISTFAASGSASSPTISVFGNTNAAPTTTSVQHPPVLSVTSGSTNIGKATAPAFGTPTTTAFSFNAVTTAAASVKSGFSFGSNAPSPISAPAATSTATTTGSLPASTSIASNMKNSPSIGFGPVATSATGQFGSTTTTTSIFSSTSSAAIFGTSSGQSVFSTSVTSTTPTSFATPSTTAISGTFGPSSTTKPASFGGFSTPGTTGSFGTPTTRSGLFATPTTSATASTFGTLPSAGAGSAFGAPSTTGTGSAFGTPSAAGTSSSFSTPTTMGSGSAFGAPSTSSITSAFSAPSTSSTTSAFSAPTNFAAGGTFGIPKTTASLFASTLTSPSTSTLPTTTSTSIFGAGNLIPSSAPTTTTSGPVFGASIGAPSGTTSSAGTNLFANTSSSTNNLSAPPPPPPGYSESTNIFGQAKPTMAFGANSSGFSGNTPLFGPQTIAPPAFGTPTATNSIATPAFGGSKILAPTFGRIAPPAAENASTSGFGSSPSMFGNNNPPPPAFGTPSSSFNAPGTSTFGSQNPTSPTFGTIGNPSGFSDNKSSMFGSQTAGTSAFGAPNTSTPAFGANANTSSGNANSSIFTFGAGQQKPPQQSSTFVFGSNASNNNNPAPAAAPFQFGASAPPKPTTGFNFTAPPAAPTMNFGAPGTPTFNTSAPGTFSIGSGSTAPRSRSTRNRKPK